ncbi:hypothetical protein N7470_001501 [Penicillium chermesinum]|nr:hypothetical protein N7470_001501 [Penicillium chermesinum]
MAPLTITVNGTSRLTRPAERGVMNISVEAEGTDKELVSLQVTSASNEMHKLFTELSPKTEAGIATAEAAVTHFSSTMLRSWHQTPRGSDGIAVARVYHASSSITATFRNFAAMNDIAGKLILNPHVHIKSIDWELTDATIQSLGQESRKLAMRDAIQKAEDYADVIGRKVVVTEINSGGYSGDLNVRCMMATAPGGALFGRSSPAPEHDSLDLTPQEIKIEGSVSVKFESETA